MAETNGKKSKLDKDWTTEEVDILINHYMSERSLWDITHSDYSKKDVRQKALAKIQEALQDKFTIAEISYKISRIRSYYYREMKRVDGSKKSGAGTADIIKSKWAYYDTLDAFLRPQIQPRKSSTNLDISSQDDETRDDDSEPDEDSLSEEASSGRQTPSDTKITPKRRKLSGPAVVIAEAVSVLSSLKTRRSSSTPPSQVPQTAAQLEDEDLTFARYLAGEIRKVKTPRVKHGLRMKLQNAIFDAQQEDEESIRQLHPQSAVSSGGFLSEMQSDMNTHFHDMTSSGINTYQPTYTNM